MSKNPIAFVLAFAAAGGILSCASTSEGLKEDAARNSKTVQGEMKEAKKDVAQGAETAAEAVSAAATDAGAQAAAMKATFDVKTALMADSRVNASRIDVDSDAASKTVRVRGKVTTQAEIDLATQIAKEHAGDWKVVNELVVAPAE